MKFRSKMQKLKVLSSKLLISSVLLLACLKISAKEFTVISLDDFSLIKGLKYQDQSSQKKIVLNKYYPNPSATFPKNNIIHFYGIHRETNALTKRPILRVSFSDQENDVIVFLRQDENDPEKINTEFLKNDPISFPYLSTMILNSSDNLIVAKLGDKIIKIAPNSRELVQLPKNEMGSFSERVQFAYKENDQSINYFFISDWYIPGGRKMLCIIDGDDLTPISLKEIRI